MVLHVQLRPEQECRCDGEHAEAEHGQQRPRAGGGRARQQQHEEQGEQQPDLVGREGTGQLSVAVTEVMDRHFGHRAFEWSNAVRDCLLGHVRRYALICNFQSRRHIVHSTLWCLPSRTG